MSTPATPHTTGRHAPHPAILPTCLEAVRELEAICHTAEGLLARLTEGGDPAAYALRALLARSGDLTLAMLEALDDPAADVPSLYQRVTRQHWPAPSAAMDGANAWEAAP